MNHRHSEECGHLRETVHTSVEQAKEALKSTYEHQISQLRGELESLHASYKSRIEGLETTYGHQIEGLHTSYQGKVEHWEKYCEQQENRHFELQQKYDSAISQHSIDLRNAEERVRQEMHALIESRCAPLRSEIERHTETISHLNQEIHQLRSSFEERVAKVRIEISEALRQKEIELMSVRQQLSERQVGHFKDCEKLEKDIAVKYQGMMNVLDEDLKAYKFQLAKYQTQYGHLKYTAHNEGSDHEEDEHHLYYKPLISQQAHGKMFPHADDHSGKK